MKIHIPNDDRLFPGRSDSQIFEQTGSGIREWAVEKITDHSGKGEHTIFEILWKSGDRSWLPYAQISHLDALNEYLEAQGVKTVSDLGNGVLLKPSTV